ncbi:MAG: hypothetical protein WD081_02410 [Gammaproteobacteria bacterium]
MADAPDDGIDWSVTTFEGARREQVRRWSRLTLPEKLKALDEMAEMARRFEHQRRAEKWGVRDTDTRDDEGEQDA